MLESIALFAGPSIVSSDVDAPDLLVDCDVIDDVCMIVVATAVVIDESVLDDLTDPKVRSEEIPDEDS